MAKCKTKQEALIAVQKDGKFLAEVDARFQDDEDVVQTALKHGGRLVNASVRLQHDPACLLCEARNGDGFEFNIDKALFCCKRDASLCDKFNLLYGKSDEFQIEMCLAHGNKYISPIQKYNAMATEELRVALVTYRKHQLEVARKIYIKGYDSNYIHNHEELFVVAGHSSLQWGAVALREEGKPFAKIVDHYPNQILQTKKLIEYYCSEGTSGSYPERLINSLLTILGVDFAREKTFPWSTGVIDDAGHSSTKRYDFYIPALSAIIEVHGSQHYDGGFENLGGRSLKEEQENDRQKEKLAKANGIKHYIILNALSSTLSYIKESILSNNDFTSLFDLTNVKWEEVEAGTVIRVKTDIRFPLYEEMEVRCNQWVEVIREALSQDDEIALSSKQETRKKYISKELRERVKGAYPSARGLYPHQLTMLMEAHKYQYPFGKQAIPSTWYYDYGIGDVTVFYQQLIDKGFLESGDIRSAVDHATVPVIKRILSEHGFPTKGRKSELIALLLEKIPYDELDVLFPERYLRLTKLGEQELSENAYILLQNKYGLSEWSLNRLVYAFPDKDLEVLLADVTRFPQRYSQFLIKEDMEAMLIAGNVQPNLKITSGTGMFTSPIILRMSTEENLLSKGKPVEIKTTSSHTATDASNSIVGRLLRLFSKK